MKFNKIFSVLACAALLSGTFACTDKVEPTPSPVAGNEEVYFPYTASPEIAIPFDATHISVTVNRVDASEESTVALTSSVNYVDESDEQNPQVVPVTDVFNIPASITFPKDVKELTLEIGVDFQKVVVDRAYYIELTLEDGKTGSYGLNHRIFQATYLPWEDWKLVSESEPGIYQQGAIWDHEYNTPVYVRKSLTNEHLTQYMVLSPFSNFEYEQVINIDDTRVMEVDGVMCPVVWMDGAIETPVANSEGLTYNYTTIFTYVKNYYQGGGKFATDEEVYAVMANNDFPVSYFNPVQGRFYLYMMVFVDGGFYPDHPLETLQLPGNYNDYYFTFNYQGNMVSNKGVESALVQVVPSTDIDHFSYNVLKGEPSEADLEKAYDALAQDPDAELIYEASYTISYPFEEEGKYTVIAVGFDKDNKVVCNNSKTYEFTTVQAENVWQSLGKIDYTDGLCVGLLLSEAAMATWEVEIQEHKETPGYYRLVNPYQNWPLIEKGLDWPLLEGNYYIELDAQDPDAVLMPMSDPGLDIDTKINPQGELMGRAQVMSEAWYYIYSNQATFAQVKAAGLCGTFADDKITFPAAGLLMLAQNGKNLFYTNTDPEAPEDAAIDYGTGCFCVDFSLLNGAPAKKIGRKSVLPSTYELKKLVNSKKEIKNAKPVSNKLSQEEIREARFKKALRAL